MSNSALIALSWQNLYFPDQGENYIDAKNDLEAIASWLEEFKHSPHTYRAYEKEGLRFFYWLHHTYQMTLRDVRKTHIHAYRAFLIDPQPYERWCAPASQRKSVRTQEQWKPFSGPLAFRSIQAALTILQGMFDYLKNAAYVSMNPFALVKQKVSDTFEFSERKILLSERLLSLEDFIALGAGLDSLDIQGQKSFLWVQRARFILYFLAYTGLRVSEFVSLRWNHFVFEKNWWIVLKGKGGKIGKVPINSACLKIISAYRAAIGLTALSAESLESCHLCTSLSKKGDRILFDSPLSDRSVHAICKEIAQSTIYSHPHLERLKAFSPHWLRHFSASMQSASNISFEMIKAHHRHSKDETTRLYMHHDELKRHQESEKFDLSEMISKKIK